MVVYLYVDPRVNPLKYYGADRFFMVPSLLAAIDWAIILGSVTRRASVTRILTLVIVGSFVIYNTNTIWKKMDNIQYQSEMMKQFLKYTINLSPQFNDQTILVVPSYLQWPLPIIIKFHGSMGMKVVVDTDVWQEQFWPVKEKVFVIDYQFDKGVDKTQNPYAGHIVDFTQKYRNGEKIKFLN
jgi:hypothetical protein